VLTHRSLRQNLTIPPDVSSLISFTDLIVIGGSLLTVLLTGLKNSHNRYCHLYVSLLVFIIQCCLNSCYLTWDTASSLLAKAVVNRPYANSWILDEMDNSHDLLFMFPSVFFDLTDASKSVVHNPLLGETALYACTLHPFDIQSGLDTKHPWVSRVNY